MTLTIFMTLASGLLHGRVSRRWDSGQMLEAAAKKLADLPPSFGSWELRDQHSLGNSAIELLQCRGYLYHTYVHRTTGRVVKVAVLVGPGSKMSIHVPEICMEASNFTMIQSRQPLLLKSQEDAAFWATTFRVNDASERRLQVVYGWSQGRSWQAPRYPRWSLANAPVLFKLQLTVPQEPGEPLEDTHFASSFLAEFLPVLARQMDSP